MNKKNLLKQKKRIKAMSETLFLLSIPGMRESIIKGKKEPIEKCLTKLPW